ncbi:GNAT family N-acetyltransferase [Erysipelothrix sp. HDW6A]|uniref:GNAT family N-acetyltransferase n=1 Tax=Erysipelothrix sp. HDW6A TaxID=2714928 RepID=UPI00140BDE76|nr:GNAT family N-acetyltransferase [Erysipelothrix sp. HDW6A]QIK56435.1 GNAT family N-acetyltransferase [Erysipelothrix sp. HDW6A]
MYIRPYTPQDLDQILKLFYDTVHTVNIVDYSPVQVDTWAPRNPNKDLWNTTLSKNLSLVALVDHEVIGFIDLEKSGYLNRLFIHKDFQSKGLASKLLKELLSLSNHHLITVDSSITALPFFLRHGFQIVRKQSVIKDGIDFTNYHMTKRL